MSLATGLATYSADDQDLALTALVDNIYALKLGVAAESCFLARIVEMGITPVDPTQGEIEAANYALFTDLCDAYEVLCAAICAGTWTP